MNSCLVPGFGSGIYGKSPWGGSLEVSAGGPLPVVEPFDIYCLGPCGPIAELLTHTEVSFSGDPLQFPIDGFTLDQVVQSGGSVSTGEAEINISTSVTEDFTLEFTVRFGALPTDFTSLTTNHIYIGASDAAGACAALLFSKVGIIYTGCAHMSGANIAFDTLLQPLPDSQLLVSENEYWTIRIAASYQTGTTYLYITKTSDLLSIGHQLRYVLPAVRSSSSLVVPPDRTLILVRGTAAQPSLVAFNGLCLGSGLIVPNIPPVADPGADRAMQLCEVLQLDGTKSFDPEGGTLLYKWRLIDAPPSSQYTFTSTDGITHPLLTPTGFADRFYSVALAQLDAADSISVGDVVVIAGKPHTIQATGTDVDGFYVRVEGFVLPDDLAGVTFEFLRQNGLNTATDAKPTFYPDAPGLYKFDLTVFDGGLFSFPESVVISVSESPVARGITPDLSFIWGYLSDFWKLVEDRERIEVFWQGLAQVAAAELLTLWQVDYSKSLRDIQRVFQRKWLHYDLLMTQGPSLLELTTVRAVFNGVESIDIAVGGVGGISGTHLDIQFSLFAAPTIVSFVATGTYTAESIRIHLQNIFSQLDSRIVVRVLTDRAGTNQRVRIDAPFPFEVLSTSTLPVFATEVTNKMPSGTGGLPVGVRSYRVERSLQYLDIKQGDFLCVDGVGYRINRVVDDVADPLLYQRLVLLDDIPTASMSATWSISGTATSRDLDFWQGLCESGDFITFEVIRIADQQLTHVTSHVLGSAEAAAKSLPCDATPVGLYLAQPDLYSVFLKSVKRRRFVPIDPLIVDVPYLQERIVSKDDTQVLRRNVDYFIDTFRDQPCIRFVTPVLDGSGPDVWEGQEPPDRMWAETTYLDNRPRIEQNFGIPAEFTLDDLSQLPDNVDYLSSVRGLWYAYFNGPTLFNLHAGTQILLGLPFAEETGLIIELREDFSDTSGRILIQDLANASITRSYTFPKALDPETNPATGQPYTVGDTVQQFAPLVTGVDVIDYVKDPKWYAGYLSQGVFFEPEKLFKFLVRVDSVAFNLSALLFVQTFIRRIKPTYTYPLFVVLASGASAEVSVSDAVEYGGRLILYEGAVFKPYAKGVSTMYDDPRASFGGWRAQFDHHNDPANPPTFPTDQVPITWAYDKNYLAPEDAIAGSYAVELLANTPAAVDMPFLRVDLPAWDAESLAFVVGAQEYVPGTPGLPLGIAQPAPATTTWNYIIVDAQIRTPASPATFDIIIKKNGVTAATLPVTLAADTKIAIPTSIAVTAADSIEVLLVSTTGNDIRTYIGKLMVTVGHAVAWTIDGTIVAGTYRGYRPL